MLILVWSIPALIVIGCIGSGRVGVAAAATTGVLSALAIAFACAPLPFGVGPALNAMLRGAWIGGTMVPYVFGGLVFWQLASAGPAGTIEPAVADDPVERRRLLFTACFVVGPFAEAATGFGIGMIGAIALARRLNLAPRHLVACALLSQTLIPWGAMASGTLIGATFANTTSTQLALDCGWLVAAQMAVWLPLFWRLAAQAGLPAGVSGCLREAVWIVLALASLLTATTLLGAETAQVAAYGPLIALRFFVEHRGQLTAPLPVLRRLLPYAALIVALTVTRLYAPLQRWLVATATWQPFPDLPPWALLFHGGSWLLAIGALTGLVNGSGGRLPGEMKRAWRTGRPAIVAVLLFAMMSEVLARSGIASALASSIFAALGRPALLVTPLLSGTFGVLTNSGTASNSLFMSAHVAFATQAGLAVPAVVALQHLSGSSMSMFSPVRMTLACSLAGIPGRQRDVYPLMLPFAAAGLLVLLLAAAAILLVPTGA